MMMAKPIELCWQKRERVEWKRLYLLKPSLSSTADKSYI
jgi:hypothetical protein